MRRHLLTHVKEEDSEVSVIGEEAETPSTEPPLSVYESIFSSLLGDGISHHTFSDIGKYVVFPENHYKRMYPSKAFG